MRQDDGLSGPRWRAILEVRWRIRLQEVTELSLAYHTATMDSSDGIEDRHARQLLRRTVRARQRLADTEDALGRLTSGSFGRCEQCGALIPRALLATAPESRYCARCEASTAMGSVMAGTAAARR
jgi:RNA polymerase-binding transcription factor DksA